MINYIKKLCNMNDGISKKQTIILTVIAWIFYTIFYTIISRNRNFSDVVSSIIFSGIFTGVVEYFAIKWLFKDKEKI